MFDLYDIVREVNTNCKVYIYIQFNYSRCYIVFSSLSMSHYLSTMISLSFNTKVDIYLLYLVMPY